MDNKKRYCVIPFSKGQGLWESQKSFYFERNLFNNKYDDIRSKFFDIFKQDSMFSLFVSLLANIYIILSYKNDRDVDFFIMDNYEFDNYIKDTINIVGYVICYRKKDYIFIEHVNFYIESEPKIIYDALMDNEYNLNLYPTSLVYQKNIWYSSYISDFIERYDFFPMNGWSQFKEQWTLNFDEELNLEIQDIFKDTLFNDIITKDQFYNLYKSWSLFYNKDEDNFYYDSIVTPFVTFFNVPHKNQEIIGAIFSTDSFSISGERTIRISDFNSSNSVKSFNSYLFHNNWIESLEFMNLEFSPFIDWQYILILLLHKCIECKIRQAVLDLSKRKDQFVFVQSWLQHNSHLNYIIIDQCIVINLFFYSLSERVANFTYNTYSDFIRENQLESMLYINYKYSRHELELDCIIQITNNIFHKTTCFLFVDTTKNSLKIIFKDPYLVYFNKYTKEDIFIYSLNIGGKYYKYCDKCFFTDDQYISNDMTDFMNNKVVNKDSFNDTFHIVYTWDTKIVSEFLQQMVKKTILNCTSSFIIKELISVILEYLNVTDNTNEQIGKFISFEYCLNCHEFKRFKKLSCQSDSEVCCSLEHKTQFSRYESYYSINITKNKYENKVYDWLNENFSSYFIPFKKDEKFENIINIIPRQLKASKKFIRKYESDLEKLFN